MNFLTSEPELNLWNQVVTLRQVFEDEMFSLY